MSINPESSSGGKKLNVLGFDIGGSGIKAAIVDTEKGELVTERVRIDTPEGGKPSSVAAVVNEICKSNNWSGIAGVGFPTLILNGVCKTAANIDKSWIGTNVSELFSQASNCKFYVLNDADAAGMAEMKMGAGKDQQQGTVMLFTLGTGIGSAIFVDGKLVPNTEFGHMEVRGKDAEKRASAYVKTEKDLSWEEWGGRLQEFLKRMEDLVPAELIIIGGGVSRKFEKFSPYLDLRAKVVPAKYSNQAGIIGAALFAEEQNTQGK
jgi:polyphosphate glucokinase